MRQRLPLVFLALIFSSIATFSHAQDLATPKQTRIEAESDSNEINFFVGGVLSAVLKQDGLHVREGINYGGMLTDYGTQHFDNEHAEKTLSQSEPEDFSHTPRIMSDPVRNAFIFIIDGEEVARLDKNGFYVRNSMAFGGTLTDTGTEWIDERIASNSSDDQEAGGNHDVE